MIYDVSIIIILLSFCICACVCFRCPIDPQIISRFEVNADRTQATAILKSMFKFPEGKIGRMQVLFLRMTVPKMIVYILQAPKFIYNAMWHNVRVHALKNHALAM